MVSCPNTHTTSSHPQELTSFMQSYAQVPGTPYPSYPSVSYRVPMCPYTYRSTSACSIWVYMCMRLQCRLLTSLGFQQQPVASHPSWFMPKYPRGEVEWDAHELNDTTVLVEPVV